MDPPFIGATIDGTWLTFDEELYNETTNLSTWAINRITGVVGDQRPNADSTFRMKFISGYSTDAEYSIKVCNYNDNSDCYKSKTVPIIRQVNSSSGYMEGG